jgi:hypothetical protein
LQVEHLIDVIDRDGDATISKLEFVERYAVRGGPAPPRVDEPLYNPEHPPSRVLCARFAPHPARPAA